MNRDRQIEILKTAQERVQANHAGWLKDPRVKATLRKNHELLKGQRTPPAKAACR